MKRRTRGRYRGFLERTADSLRDAVERVAYAEHSAARRGWLQRLDPRVKLIGLLSLVVVATMAKTVRGIVVVLAIALVLAAASRLSMRALFTRVWLGALAFSSAIAVPACFLTPGRVVYRVPGLDWPVTFQGLASALYLVLRVEAAVTLTALLVFTTPWPHVLKALRSLRVPVVVVVVLGMAYRYVLLLLDSAHAMFEARRSRMVGAMSGADSRRLAGATAGVLLDKTLQLGGDVYLAMQSRGFRGDVHLLDEFRVRPRDWLALVAFAALVVTAVWVGR